jgi:hypothetical protein
MTEPMTVREEPAEYRLEMTQARERLLDWRDACRHTYETDTKYICSPLDLPQGLGWGYFVSWEVTHARGTSHQADVRLR